MVKIVDAKGEGRYYIVLFDLRERKDEEPIISSKRPAFNICVYDMENVGGDWNKWKAVTAADTEEKAREAMENFYNEYYPK